MNILDEIFRMMDIGISLVHSLTLPGYISSTLAQPWGLVTYMFLHKDFFHILFNMLWLYWLGKIFVEYVSSKRLVAVYLMGGISGGLLYVISGLIAPHLFSHTILLGASAGVMAVVISTAVLLPEYALHLLFFGAVRLKYIALISFVLTSLLDISQNTGGKISHIGGALFGLVFMLWYKNGKDISKPVVSSLDWLSSVFSPKPKVQITYSKAYSRPKTDEEYYTNQRLKQQRIDEILDKISKSGYDALTKEEKDFLFKASGRN